MGLTSTAFLAGLLAAPLAAAEPTASQLIHKSADVWRGSGNHGVMVMTVETPNWTRQMTVEGWTDGQDKALIIIRAPQKERGTATLRYGPRLWTWLPRAERVMSIPQDMMHDSWMGSDFNYEDIVKAGTLTKDYEHRVVEKKARPGGTDYVLESKPKEGAAIVWGRVLTRGRLLPSGAFLVDREEYYGESGELIRMMSYSDYSKVDGRQVPHRLECVPKTKEGHRTTVTYNELRFDLDLPDDLFTLERLQAHD